MSWVDVDVIAKTQNIVGGVDDKRLKLFLKELENQNVLAKQFKVSSEKLLVKDVVNVYDMVTRILSGIGNRRIRRLRVFGHGSPQTIQMGPFMYTGRGGEASLFTHLGRDGEASPLLTKIVQEDMDKIIQVVLTPELKYDILNLRSLEKLKGHFDPCGWVELQSCRVMDVPGDGDKLIEGLSNFWNVPVQASDARQVVGGGFEGNVWQARPGKKAEKIRVQAQSSGLNPASRTLLAGSDPLKDAFDSLKPRPGPGFQMSPRTSYSDITTGKSYFVNSVGRHVETGSIRGFTPQPELGRDLMAYRVRNDPLKDAFDSLKPRLGPGFQMSSGTSYSDITTGKSYFVNSMGRHVETGSIRGFTPQPELGRDLMAYRVRNDPLKDALRMLGG